MCQPLLGFNYRELIDGVAKEGTFVKEYRNGPQITLVFRIQDMAGLSMILQIIYKSYIGSTG